MLKNVEQFKIEIDSVGVMYKSIKGHLFLKKLIFFLKYYVIGRIRIDIDCYRFYIEFRYCTVLRKGHLNTYWLIFVIISFYVCIINYISY